MSAGNDAPPAGGYTDEGPKNIIHLDPTTANPADDTTLVPFRAAMVEAGFEAPENLRADGRMHRFPAPGEEPPARSAWYLIGADGLHAIGIFGDSRSDSSHVWRAQNANRIMPLDECRLFLEIVERIKRARDAEAATQRAKYASELEQQWLTDPHGGKWCDVDGRDGEAGPIVVCVSFATAAAVLDAVPWWVRAVPDPADMEDAAHAARTAFPDAEIIVAGTRKSVLIAARAAVSVGAGLALPFFAHDEISEEMNALAAHRGLEAVADALTSGDRGEGRHDR